MATRRNMGTPPSYDTPLTPEQQVGFSGWQRSLPVSLQNSGDYDLQGAYLAGAAQNARAHMTDQFKKPNHMTFSDGSQYSTPQTPGGHWTDTTPGVVDEAKKRFVFWASNTNLQAHPLAQMAEYFRQNEPNSTLVLPIDYQLTARK